MRVQKKAPTSPELFSGCFLCVVSAAANNKVVSDGTHGGYRTLLRSFDGILPRVLSAAEHLLASPVSCLLCGGCYSPYTRQQVFIISKGVFLFTVSRVGITNLIRNLQYAIFYIRFKVLYCPSFL